MYERENEAVGPESYPPPALADADGRERFGWVRTPDTIEMAFYIRGMHPFCAPFTLTLPYLLILTSP